MSKLTYKQAVDWLNSSQRLGMKPGLKRINSLLDHLGIPEKNFQSIHVGGTNGKGSVCRYLSSILMKEGYKIGLFTSPHLFNIRERFSINEIMISEKEFSLLISKLKDVVEHEDETLRPTYFEICTALMFLYFDMKKVDYAIIEVGLGGRYDATNVIKPILSIITNVSYDHTDILGDTIEKITFEKAGIIKDGIPLVTAAEKKALTIIKEEVIRHHTTMVHVADSKSTIIKHTPEYQLIRVKGMLDEYNLKTHEIGTYQRKNLALAIAAIEQLQMMGVFISPESITKGVELMFHQGRMKIIHTNPTIIIDGAHNSPGMKELNASIHSLFQDKNIILVFGVLKDKDINQMIKEIYSLCQKIIITKPDNLRAADSELVKNIASSYFSNEQIIVTHTIPDAIDQGLKHASNDDIVLITGSLYLISEVMDYFEK